MTEDNLLLSMMTLRTNGLTLLLKDKIWQNILKKKMVLLQEIHFRFKDSNRLKVSEWKDIS